MNISKVVKPEIPSQPMRRPRRSSSRSSLSKAPTNKNLQNWYTLQNSLLDLNEKNYMDDSKAIINKLRNIIQSGCSQSSSMVANAVLYIIYERSVQELILQTFPVSASIIDSLASSSSEDVFSTVQPLIQLHLKQLQTKLQNTAKLCGTDVGVICLLINMCKLEQLANRTSPEITSIIEQILKDAAVYVELAAYEKDIINDALIILLFCLAWFGIRNNSSGPEFAEIKMYIRKSHIKNYRLLSPLARVLVLDILEQIQNVDINVKLYSTMYKKIIYSNRFLLSGIEDFISGIPYPLEGDASTIDMNRKYSTEDDVFSMLSSSPDFITPLPTAETSTALDKLECDSVGSPNAPAECIPEEKMPTSASICKKLSSSSISSNDDAENEGDKKWARKVSNDQKREQCSEEKMETEIFIPERCVGRVSGLEGAILRKLEIQSKASICISNKEYVRPETTSLTAHRLITGALGMRAQMPTEQVKEERQKLSEARVKRQAEQKEEQMRHIRIVGSQQQVQKAKALIEEITNNIITISVPLKYNVDDLMQCFGDKFKTIEVLLNVYMEIQEEDTFRITVDISGDEKSCLDAKKLIFEEVGTFKTQSGQMFYIPSEMKALLKSSSDMKHLINTVRTISEAHVCEVIAPKGDAIFVSGMFSNVNKALSIFQAANVELMYTQSVQPDTEVTMKDICHFIGSKFSRSRRGSRRSSSRSPTMLPVTDGSIDFVDLTKVEEHDQHPPIRFYTRMRLLEFGRAPSARLFPDTLKAVMENDPPVACIILTKGRSQSCNEALMSSLESPWV